MITEDYVSFELANLLNEKGFDEPCRARYDNNGFLHYEKYPIDASGAEMHNSILCQTVQMVMKWLREVYSISIDICTVQGREVSYMFNIWDFSNIQDNKFIGGTFDLREQLYDFKTYEEAVELAIKYCLEKLI